jgi:hypothetical protein
MKINRWLYPMVLIFVLAFSSFEAVIVCGAISKDAAVYYPLKTGNKWIYNVSLPDGSSYKQTVTVLDPEKKKIRERITYEDNLLAELHFTETNQGLYKMEEVSQSGVLSFDPYQMVLSSKLIVGSSWSWESKDGKMKETAKVIATEKVTVPAGEFTALVVQCEGIDETGISYVDKTWYVKKVGYVKHVYSADGKIANLELAEYTLAK